MSDKLDPSKLRIVLYPHEALLKVCEPVEEINDYILQVCDRMEVVLKSMPHGIGLAASQVGLDCRIYVAYQNLDQNSKYDEVEFYINPEFSPEDILSPVAEEEGCLSLPGIKGDVLRPTSGTLAYTNKKGERVFEHVDGLKARCAQHEIDHLNGVTLVESMTEDSRKRAKAAIARLKKAGRRR